MQEKINYLKERIDNISSIIGEESTNSKTLKAGDNKSKTISDSINYIKSQMNDNNNNSLLEIFKKSK